MQMQAATGYAGGQIPNPYMAYGAPVGFAPLTDEAGVYLPTGPGDAQRMELLNMGVARRAYIILNRNDRLCVFLLHPHN